MVACPAVLYSPGLTDKALSGSNLSTPLSLSPWSHIVTSLNTHPLTPFGHSLSCQRTDLKKDKQSMILIFLHLSESFCPEEFKWGIDALHAQLTKRAKVCLLKEILRLLSALSLCYEQVYSDQISRGAVNRRKISGFPNCMCCKCALLSWLDTRGCINPQINELSDGKILTKWCK